MKIGITGCTGNLGKRLVEILIERDIDIVCLIRNTSKINNFNKDKIEFIYGDICNFGILIEFIKKIDVCIHLAALIRHATKKEYYNVNIKGTKNLCKAIVQYNPDCRFIYGSTISTLKVNPFFKFLSSNYAISKYYAEKEVLKYIKKKKLKATIIYPGLIYSPYDNTVLPQIINAIKKGNIKFIKGGESKAPFIYVDELCELFIKSALNEIAIGKRYISVKGLELGIHDIIKIIADKLGYEVSGKIYSKTFFLAIAIFMELFFKIFIKNKKPFINRTVVDVLSINYKNYKKRFDDAKKDLNWDQDISKEYFLKKINYVLKYFI